MITPLGQFVDTHFWAIATLAVFALVYYIWRLDV